MRWGFLFLADPVHNMNASSKKAWRVESRYECWVLCWGVREDLERARMHVKLEVREAKEYNHELVEGAAVWESTEGLNG